MRGGIWLGNKREPVIGPSLEKPLLKLHRAKDVKSFWKAVHRLLSASIAYHSAGLLLQQNPSAPVVAKWTRFMVTKGRIFVACGIVLERSPTGGGIAVGSRICRKG